MTQVNPHASRADFVFEGALFNHLELLVSAEDIDIDVDVEIGIDIDLAWFKQRNILMLCRF